MKLALIIDDYLPDSTRVGAKMFHELALELMASGHNVTVITPAVGQAQKFTEQNIDGVNVWRFSSGPIKDVGKVTRALNETLLSFRAWSAIKHRVNDHTFDGVIYYSPSIFFGGLVNKIKQRCKCPSYLVLRDLFPQWVIDAGMLKKGSFIERYFRIFEQSSYQAADTIGLMSEKNIEVFTQSNRTHYPTEILRNWANTTPIKGVPSLAIRAIDTENPGCLLIKANVPSKGSIHQKASFSNLLLSSSVSSDNKPILNVLHVGFKCDKIIVSHALSTFVTT